MYEEMDQLATSRCNSRIQTDFCTLQAIQERTAAMVAAEMRSEAVVVTRLLELINSAQGGGHPHRAIHAAIARGGLPIAWNNYRSALQRARRASRAEAPAAPASPRADAASGGVVVVPVGLSAPRAEPVVATAMDVGLGQAEACLPSPAFTGPSNTVELMDALRRARQVSTSTDFARIAREQLRAREKELKRKGMQ